MFAILSAISVRSGCVRFHPDRRQVPPKSCARVQRTEPRSWIEILFRKAESKLLCCSLSLSLSLSFAKYLGASEILWMQCLLMCIYYYCLLSISQFRIGRRLFQRWIVTLYRRSSRFSVKFDSVVIPMREESKESASGLKSSTTRARGIRRKRH